ncbi:WD40 repeat-like protein [Lindgomyces ingoldianus]|uniref:WD40 repeat-like protein n=1 Tax=Lindgomyces ingoldianus TaxID=673940 RepID=A0ACB6RCA4_9PLEO|nr:WD40 repeat-like protein [Lindgomyces ingoldianus]KAF2476393.1 WD40 repeat-like protein [Lindgomyces ingoldianus]
MEEKKAFDISLNFEKLGIENLSNGWRRPAPSVPVVLDTLPTTSNILSIHLLDLVTFNDSGTEGPKQCIATATADRRLNLIKPDPSCFSLLRSYTHFQDSPILDFTVVNCKYLLTASMSGRLLLYNTEADQILDERRDHSKYIVKIAKWSTGLSMLVASAGWDSKLNLYRLEATDDGIAKIGEPVATLGLTSIPETILFIESSMVSSPILLLSRRDSTFLYYYSVPPLGVATSEITLLGKQNLAPLSNAWVAFSPSDVQLCPSDPSLVAVATSTTPHMKLLLVRLLVPPNGPSASNVDDSDHYASHNTLEPVIDSHNTLSSTVQASQARENLIMRDREEAAIILSINTLAPQTAYSTPKLAWRPDGSGVYVSSDDGVIRGFEASTGKLITSLEGHAPGFKIRCLWAGFVKGDSTDMSTSRPEEWLISGGFDQKLIVWRDV